MLKSFNTFIKRIVVILLSLIISLSSFANSTSPVLNQGKKWRIAYYEGGPFLDYQKTLNSIIKELMNLNWIEKKSLPEPSEDNGRLLWHYLSHHIESKYLEFPEDAFYSSEWNDVIRKKTSKLLLDRISKKKDIDIVIAAGTHARARPN